MATAQHAHSPRHQPVSLFHSNPMFPTTNGHGSLCGSVRRHVKYLLRELFTHFTLAGQRVLVEKESE
jgi:hypothetical protein